MALTCEDWRQVAPSEMLPLYRGETERWSAVLDWDTAASWHEVERGRTAGHVAGWLVRDQTGKIVGWSYHLVHNGALQIGGLVAADAASAQLMLDATLSSETVAAVDEISFFAFADVPELIPALRRHGLGVERYWYMFRQAVQVIPPPMAARRWRPEDARATAELLQRAYRSPEQTRPFAPRGTPAQWLDYVVRLTQGPGCGTLISEACVVLPAGPNRLAAVALVTRIAPGVAHLAQLAVDPGSQREGIASSLVDMVCVAAARAGCPRLTLLVGGRNSAGRRLYESARFETGPSFLAAGRFQPRRSTSVAPGASVMTFR